MNFNDVYKKAIKLDGEAQYLYEVCEELKKCLEFKTDWEMQCNKILIYNDVAGGHQPNLSYATKLDELSRNFMGKFKKMLMNINCINFWMKLPSINNEYDVIIDSRKLISNITENFNIIHQFMNKLHKEEEFMMEYTKVLDSINAIIYEGYMIKERIEAIKRVNFELNNKIDSPCKLRLLNQRNNLSDTIESLSIINDIYNTICKITNEFELENELNYTRVESGSFLLNLLGDPEVLAIVGGVITFSYKVYNDHFSTKAKQEKIMGDLKIRRDLIGLIKESKEIINDEELVKTSLAQLEISALKLYKKSSAIEYNGEIYGNIEVDEKGIDKYLKDIQITGFIEESKDN